VKLNVTTHIIKHVCSIVSYSDVIVDKIRGGPFIVKVALLCSDGEDHRLYLFLVR